MRAPRKVLRIVGIASVAGHFPGHRPCNWVPSIQLGIQFNCPSNSVGGGKERAWRHNQHLGPGAKAPRSGRRAHGRENRMAGGSSRTHVSPSPRWILQGHWVVHSPPSGLPAPGAEIELAGGRPRDESVSVACAARLAERSRAVPD